MSILTDLSAALAAVDAARKTLAQPLPLSEVAYLEREEALYSALGTYHKLLTDDTIRALLEAVEAAEREPRCPFCAEERHISGWPTQPHLSDCPLAPLVKEATDE
jgi:hypothetical protein